VFLAMPTFWIAALLKEGAIQFNRTLAEEPSGRIGIACRRNTVAYRSALPA
jgi:hypothetical protein